MKKVFFVSLFALIFVISVFSSEPTIHAIKNIDENKLIFKDSKYKEIASWTYKDDGTIQKEGQIINGLAEIEWEFSYAEHRYAEVVFKDNEFADGKVLWKINSGTPFLEENYKNGKLEGVVKTFYSRCKGCVECEYNYSGGNASDFTCYFQNGNKSVNGKMTGNKREGVAQLFSEEFRDQPSGEAVYMDGKLVVYLKADKVPKGFYEDLRGAVDVLKKAGLVFSIEQEEDMNSYGSIALKGPSYLVFLGWSQDKQNMKKKLKYISEDKLGFYGNFYPGENIRRAKIKYYSKMPFVIGISAENENTLKEVREKVFKALGKMKESK
ncbi:MAG: hypothetical protein CVV21_04465 [Candidatus Goldiibacteriota bacterium HGW-Goldbacteria-1]|jgi:antitoxin component YwqK of YwqJK toxin-antitoxin module|nr:MAG: hypothetical protein CVV21_04465 [Candidatus Goldiibacteriota bacterium HGW-Goldbacteria-1]